MRKREDQGWGPAIESGSAQPWACLAFSMIGDFENAARLYGDRGYRYVHFEAGAIGLRATGVGAVLDQQVNQYLALSPELGQVVYHFAIGYPVADPRLEA